MEHNFGHGREHLSDVLASLMMLAFLIDQVEQHCCALFWSAREEEGRLKYRREEIRAFFLMFRILDGETLYLAIAFPTTHPSSNTTIRPDSGRRSGTTLQRPPTPGHSCNP